MFINIFNHQPLLNVMYENPKNMCFHTALNATPAQLSTRYGKENSRITPFSPTFHISGFNHDYYPIITADPQIQPAQWGLIPFWTKTPEDAISIRDKTLNARSESAFSKPSFRNSIRNHRCLIPVTGFFDWHHKESTTIPYYIQLRDTPIFSLAGIYDYWKDPISNQDIITFSVLTTEANELMSQIHNTNFRMPVIISPDSENKWIDNTLSENQIKQYMHPYMSDLMQAYPIKNDFLKKVPTDPSILFPREENF